MFLCYLTWLYCSRSRCCCKRSGRKIQNISKSTPTPKDGRQNTERRFGRAFTLFKIISCQLCNSGHPLSAIWSVKYMHSSVNWPDISMHMWTLIYCLLQPLFPKKPADREEHRLSDSERSREVSVFSQQPPYLKYYPPRASWFFADVDFCQSAH